MGGGADPSWTRTDDAANFADPNPYYSGMSGSPSSPFDNIMPWSGMKRVTDASAGELVEIPKFYYLWTRDGDKMKLQISRYKHNGFYTSPAHADRGDGVGERDYVYVGRYHCASDYKSKTGVTPKASATRATFRSSIHNLGSNIWQFDFAMYWTICMLYLVEFANWDSQTKIGYGCGNGSSLQNTGLTDTMSYHTGTIKNSRTTYGVGIQYRYVEDLWADLCDWIDGIYLNTNYLYCIKNPSAFSDTSGGTLVLQCPYRQDGYIKSWTANSTTAGFEYIIWPSTANWSDISLYVPDYFAGNFNSINGAVTFFGGPYKSSDIGAGLFSLFGYLSSQGNEPHIGSRLMVLPSSRLSA